MPGRAKLYAVAATLAGGAAMAVLLWWIGVADILDAMAGIGWGLVAIAPIHVVQMLFSALGWRAVTPAAAARPVSLFLWLRWIREGVNNLLPVAQVGGDLVAARLLALRGIRVSDGGAGVAADKTVEMVTQAAFTLMGLGLLLAVSDDDGLAFWAALGLLLLAAAAGGFLLAQRAGVFRLFERLLLRIGEGLGSAMLGSAAGLHDALVGIYRDRGALAAGGAHHMISWVLGGAEVALILHFLDAPVGLVAGIVIESLGQAIKSVGFAVPGALAVQEGGYIAIGAVFGLGPETAVALSLVKRLREAALGVPALLAWQWAEGWRLARRTP